MSASSHASTFAGAVRSATGVPQAARAIVSSAATRKRRNSIGRPLAGNVGCSPRDAATTDAVPVGSRLRTRELDAHEDVAPPAGPVHPDGIVRPEDAERAGEREGRDPA